MDHISELTDAHEHLTQALEHLAADRPDSAKRRCELARAAVGRVIESMGYQEPTAATGAQTSVGQSPRHASNGEIVSRLLTSCRRGARELKR